MGTTTLPFSRAPLAIALLLALTGLAFWRAYWGVLGTAPAAFHLHGLTATIWLLLLAGQSWTIHARRLASHRALGRASLWFFPVFVAGMGAVLHSMSAATPADPFYAMHGSGLGLVDLVAAVMVVGLYATAVAHRRDPHLHARAMMATALFLLSPVFGRLAGNHLPPLAITDPSDFWKFTYAVQLGNVVAVAITLLLYRMAPRRGRIFLVAAAALLLQTLLFPVVDHVPGWTGLFLAVGRAPLPPVVIGFAIVGAGAAVWGWAAGSRARAAPRPRAA